MPTGYTAPIYEGKDVTLQDFASECSRAFGAFIHQRDSSGGTLTYPPKPDEDSYYSKALEKAIADKALWESYTEEEKYVLWSEYYRERLAKKEEETANRAGMRGRYLDLIEQVDAVEVPERLAEFKKFMLDQLRDSMKFDCPADDKFTESYYTPLEFAEWCEDYDRKVERDIVYYNDELNKEWSRYYDRMSYIKLMETYFGIKVEEV